MNIDFSQLESLKCDNCGSEHFEQVFLLKRVPAVVSPTATPTIAPAQIFRCAECKHVNEELMPK